MAVRVGIASWTGKTLGEGGRFYPKHVVSAEARLRYYASRFPIVEVDSSYYAMPRPATTQLWAERTPEGFVMNVKAFRLFTGHQTQPTLLGKDLQQALGGEPKRHVYYHQLPAEIIDELWRRFHAALQPLQSAGRLGLVHFQFPPWIGAGRAGHAHVAHCVERMGDRTVSVEFRHHSWWTETQLAATLAFEREQRVVHTVVDGPQGYANSVPAVWEATHPGDALLRLHGRNAATWNAKGPTAASDRFSYDYGDDELAAMVPAIAGLERLVPRVHVIFNNNVENRGQRNAQTLMKLLEAA